MKKLFFLILPSLLIVSCISEGEVKTEENLSAEQAGKTQEQSKEETIVANTESSSGSASKISGKWKLEEMDTGMEIPEEKKEMVEAMIKDVVANTWVELKDDGTLTSQTKMQGQIMTETGTWRQEGDKLITTNSKQKTEALTIISASDDELILSADQQGTVITMTYSKANI